MKNLWVGVAVAVTAAFIGVGGAYIVSKTLPESAYNIEFRENMQPRTTFRSPRGANIPGALEFWPYRMGRMDCKSVPFIQRERPQNPTAQHPSEEGLATPDAALQE